MVSEGPVSVKLKLTPDHGTKKSIKAAALVKGGPK